MQQNKISDFGEKKLIEQFIKPLFNPNNDLFGIGDDCAMIDCNENETLLLSTDRVPTDLTPFKLGLIGFFGMGKHLANLNISDIAACGGKPVGLLLNFGLPNSLLINDFQKLLDGIKSVIDKVGCKVLGGDITSSREISISATSIGKVQKGRALTRRNAKEGDYIFISRPIGLTPTALEYFCNLKPKGFLFSRAEEQILIGQFTDMFPLCELGQQLSNSCLCTSCMDNTDGLGQSLLELSQLSNVAMEVYESKISLHELTKIVSEKSGNETTAFAFSAGADFSLVGTLSKEITETDYQNMFPDISIIGRAGKGNGVKLIESNNVSKLKFNGWNYFLTSDKVIYEG